MKTKSVLMAVIVATMLIPQSLAFGQRRGFDGWGGMFGGPMQAAYLGLTQDQMSQIRTMRQTQWSTLKPLMQQLRTDQQQLRAMTHSTRSLNGLTALAGQIAQVQAQITVAQATMRHQIYNNVLTATQQAQLAQLQQNMQQMRQNRHNSQSSGSSSGSNQ